MRRRHLHEPSDKTTHRPPSRNRLELTVSRSMKSGFLAAVIAALSAASLVVLAAPASSSGSPLDITYMSSLTGPGASEYANSQLGCVARVDLQNAEGGIDGRKVDLSILDDETNPTLTSTAVKSAIAKGAMGIVANSPLFYLAAKYAQQAGMPVTGNSSDGPEWGEQPYTNMFDAFRGSENPADPVNSIFGNFLKSHGGTTIGTYGYGVSPNSAGGAIGGAESFQRAGGKIGVEDASILFGGVDFGPEALVAKEKNVNAILPTMDDDSDFALLTALKQAGVKVKAALLAVGYEPSVVHSPAWPSLQGAYFLSLTRPLALPNAGTEQMARALTKYAHFTKTEFPNFSQALSWLGCDLMIQGLERAGPNPSRAGVVKALRGIKAYNGNGLLPITINYSTVFGHDLPQCAWVMQAQKSGFVPVSAKPFCGTDYAGTSTRTGS
jgi:branched-chain amino acid transport system substrate-binding protein